MVVKLGLVFALSRLFVIIWPFVCNVGMPMHSRLFALMNDQNCFVFVLNLDFLQCSYLGSLSRIWLQLCWLVFRVS